MTLPDWLMAVLSVASATLRFSTPLILCAIGGLLSERGGIVDIGLEGKMLAAAFAAAAVASVTGSAPLGLAAASATGLALAAIHGFASITRGGNQVVSGVAINMLASGLTIVFGQAWFGSGGATPALPASARFMPLPGGFPMTAYLALASVPVAALLLSATRFGLRLRAVGENPLAVEAAGIAVAPLRYQAVLMGGVLAGIAGTYLSLSQAAGFSREMSAGQGYIALAAVIFGKWRPWPTLGACLLFGLIDALSSRLQGGRLFGIGEVPVQVFQVLPYGLTVLLLAGFVGRSIPPAASGIPYRGAEDAR